MSDFLIGFEFEFGWLPSHFPIKKPKSKPQFFEHFIFPEVKSLLDKSFPGIELEIKEDCTLKFNPHLKYWQTYYGVEVVSLPMSEDKAVLFLTQFITWLQSQKNIQINKTCSLHLNLNFIDKEINHKIDYWKLLSQYPQDKTLKLFNRQKNEYCQNTHLVKIGLEENSFISKERTLSYWKNKLSSVTDSFKLKMIEKTFNSERYEFSKQLKQIKVISQNTHSIFNSLDNSFKKKIHSMKKNLSIVKKNETNPYYEFRMIGNKDYHLKMQDILDTLSLSKESLIKSI